MDLNVMIMSAIIIAICVLPMIVLSRKQNLKKKRLKNILADIAKTKSVEIASHELCGHLAVGISQNDEAFLFYNKHEDETESKSCVLLSEIRQCTLFKTSRNSSSGNIGKLSLNFEYLDKSKSDLILDFFNASESFQLVGELQLVEKWKPIIDKAINTQKVTRQSVQAQKDNIRQVSVLSY